MTHYLQTLRARITYGEQIESGLFISEKDIRTLREYVPQIFNYIGLLNKLPFQHGTTLNVIDFDNTIHSRHYQLNKGLLQDNRGSDGNRVIDSVIGRSKMIEEYYDRSAVVFRIAQILNSQNQFHQARIITVGDSSWQVQKTRATGVFDSKNGIHTVPEARLKIESVLKEILKLGYIPAKIIIYEDRPEHFKRVAGALSRFLGGIEIVINQVVLSQQEVIRRQISDIYQTIFKPQS